MYNTHVRAVRDLRNKYAELSEMAKSNHDQIIITSNGKSDTVLIAYADYAKYEDFLHARYVREKLAEAEAMEGREGAWMALEDLWAEWDRWDLDEMQG
jgi:prevent-host-death family protein